MKVRMCVCVWGRKHLWMSGLGDGRLSGLERMLYGVGLCLEEIYKDAVLPVIVGEEWVGSDWSCDISQCKSGQY